MKKIEIKPSESSPDKIRLIINVEENISIGVLLEKSELNLIKNEIEEILDSMQNDL